MFSLELKRLKGDITAGYKDVKIGAGKKEFSMLSMNISNIKQN